MSELYMIQLRGELLPSHPLYWQAGVSVYTVLLFADSREDAESRAREYCRLAHFQPNEIISFGLVKQPYEEKLPEEKRIVLRDGIYGHGLHLAVGLDEAE